MSHSSRPSSRLWLIFPACALGFIAFCSYARMQRVTHVSGLDAEEAVVDSASPTGYAHNQRWLVVPERNSHSYEWISETQQMLARHEWRVRHVDYDNAPLGRDVSAASPYRWWLGLVAWGDHVISGRPPGLSVERAALWADPLLHLLLLLGSGIFVARLFGPWPSTLLVLGLATLFPFAAGFLPGAPDAYGLTLAITLGSVLPLLAGIEHAGSRRVNLWFFLAGVAGGFGLWIDAATAVPILTGIALGGLFATGLTRFRSTAKPVVAPPMRPWRTWALGGATTSLAAYLIEYAPAHLDLRLQVNHPLYALAWVGVGELLWQAELWFQPGKAAGNFRRIGMLFLAVITVAALPVSLALTHSQGFLTRDLLASRLTSLPNGVVAPNLAAWVARDGLTPAFAATVGPLLLLGSAIWLLFRQEKNAPPNPAVALALGPAVVALGFASLQLRWWGVLDATLLALLVAATAAPRPGPRWLWPAFVGLILAPGLLPLVAGTGTGGNDELTRSEVEGLVDRTLAHWVADHSGPAGAVVLAPPDLMTSLCFYGGLRGLGTPTWENQEGLAATIRIISATTPDNAQRLLGESGVTHIILPSWDTDLDEFVRLTGRPVEDTFLHALHLWSLPPWLRALPYRLPAVAGFEDQSVAILEVTTDNNRALTLSRLAEYFIESDQLEPARATAQALQKYPADLGALVALAEVQKSGGDAAGFDRTFQTILSNLAGGFDRNLTWDRRVSLAVVLAQGERTDLAREQVRRCLEKLDEARLRFLTTGSLFRLLALSKAFALPLPDPQLGVHARQLLPPELRQRLD